MSALLELRILTGIHAGARGALEGDACVLGTAPECDVVLADPGLLPQHARLVRTDAGWQLELPASTGSAPLLLPPGAAAAVGPVLVAVDDPSAPWPALAELSLVQAAPATEAPAAAAVEAPGPEPSSDPQPMAVAPAVPVPMRGRRSARRHPIAWAVGAGTVLLSAAALVAWPMTRHRDDPATHVALTTTNLVAQRAAIDEILRAQRLEGRVQVDQEASGRLLVKASYLRDEEAEQLVAALSRVKPRPGLRLSSEQDLRQDVGDAVLRLGGGNGVVRARYLGEARFQLEGRVDTTQARVALLQGLQSAFPQVRAWEANLTVTEEVGEQLLGELRAAGFEAASGQWADGVFQMAVKLPPQQVPAWEKALVRALQRHTLPISAKIDVQPAPDPVPVKLPFQLRGVVGGDMPYVLMEDGSKLLPEGSVQGWKLRAIEADRVVFEQGARRAVLAR